MPSLSIILGKAKKRDAEEEPEDMPEEEESSSGMAEDYAREAFKAAKEDDEEGFVQALVGLMSCGDAE